MTKTRGMGSYTRTFTGILLLHLALVAVLFAAGVRRGWAQQSICGPAAVVIDALTNGFGEQDIGGGQLNPQLVMRIYAAPGGATFSIVTIATDGSACVQTFGKDFELSAPPRADERKS